MLRGATTELEAALVSAAAAELSYAPVERGMATEEASTDEAAVLMGATTEELELDRGA